METKFEYIKSKIISLFNSEFVSFDYVRSKTNVMGVYLIYNHKSELVYIGNTNKFHIRFGTDLLNETTHTLVKKMINSYGFKNRPQYQEYIKYQCKYRIICCETKHEAEAIEHFAIYLMNPPFNK